MSVGRAGPPSFDILGSFFPAWTFCVVLGVVVTVLCRFLLLRVKLEQDVGPLVLFYPCVVTLTSCVLWLILYR